MLKIIARGAEAIISEQGGHLVKLRVKKEYRHSELDEKLRTLRTRHEAKLLEKIQKILPVPKVISVDEKNKEIILEKINGRKLSKILEKTRVKDIGKQLGEIIAKMHENGVIHGDLTTSNMMLSKRKVYLIDFGLGFYSNRVEDKAVDLHVLREALYAKHPKSAKTCWESFKKAYAKTSLEKSVLTRLEQVEKRGRYKTQY